ncbi:beta strand repeat-containing protein [Aestuariivirga sp.]|uniref:beta strand repeat-containing protein n=1 Tax=Aestuariivirga sp. TaxID=2650926 RepID=UPI003592FB13
MPTAALAGDFAITWGTSPYTWTSGALGPQTYALTDQYGFQLNARLQITRTGGIAAGGTPDDLTGYGTNRSLQLQWNASSGSSGIGQSTNTATLEVLNGATAYPVDDLSFLITDIDATDANASTDVCDFVTVTGNTGTPTLSYVSATAATRSVRIGPGAGSGSTPTLASNQAQCIYNTGSTSSPTSSNNANGSIRAAFPAGTHTATVAFDESIENVYGVTSRNAGTRGIGIWDTTAFSVANTISLAKSTPTTRYTAAGQVITYTFTVTNNGPLPINTGQNIQIQDSKIGTFTCGTISTAIASGGTHTCTRTYTVTVTDVSSSGGVTNIAIAGVGTGTQSFATRLQSNSVQVTVANGAIDAVNDSFISTPINGTSGGTTASVFTNDTLGGAAFASSAAIPALTSNGGLTGAALNASGTITVPPGTTSGSYTLTYEICDAAFTSVCDTATAAILVSASPATGGTSCVGTNVAINGGFELPNYAVGPSYRFVTSVPGWTTTDSAIEIWDTGFNGVPAHTGDQFAELNANIAGTLTQPLASILPSTQVDVYWAHRAREGTDTARLVISDNGGGSTDYGNFSTSTAAWVVRSATHVASSTATTLSMAFTAVSTGSGNISIGNFLDTVEVCQTYVTLDKTELSRTDTDGSTTDTAGDIVTYQYAISNPAGNNRSLGAVSVTDDKLGTFSVATPLSGDSNTNGFLDPGETWITTAAHTLTQADINTGTLTNIAYASASTGTNTLQSVNDQVTISFSTVPQLAVVKTAALVKAPGNTLPGVAQAGDTINYTYAVTNTGNLTFTNVEISDVHNGTGTWVDPTHVSLTDTGTASDSPDSNADATIWGTLAPGDTVNFATAYTVIQNDVDTLQ